ncbi:S-type pyocin domain-containing protein [Pseudomonas sp. NFX98]|uniref:S-type pyocin domain-containing protein n=1 Tax=Pseudomonas sp. NFX98 TaxID=3399122 RepID=UPI0039FD0579
MQRPPTRPKDQKSRPGFLEIDTPVDIVGVAPDHFISPARAGNNLQAGPFGPGVSTYNQNRGTVLNTTRALEQEYQIRLGQLPQTIELELSTTRLEGPTNPVPPLQSVARELGVLSKLTERKTTQFYVNTATAHAFYGGDPFNRHINVFMIRATKIEKWPGPNGIAMQALHQSLRAAIEARLLAQTLQSLQQRTAILQHTSSVMQATEQARIRAETEALAHAQEQARLAALAEAERVAAEQARITAEAAAQYFAAEQARLEAEAEVQRQAELLRLENERQVQEKTLRESMESLNAVQGIRPFPVSGAAAANGAVFAVGAGTLAVDAATTIAIRTALRSAVAAAITASAAVVGTASGAVIVVGVAALVYYALRDKQEPHTLSVPLSDLTTYDADGLYAIAEANGEIELPVALGSKTTENTTEFVVAAANGTTVPDKVPVRLATYDPVLNVYSTHHPDAPGIGMTWTPIVRPVDESTVLPVHEPNVVAYEGATLTALEGRIDTSPALDLYSFGGFIYVFPIESGVPPLYVVFSTPYDGATAVGMHSGRKFNPEKSGGPILELDWRTATVSRQGVDLVRLHTARLDQSDANDIMIRRLEKVLKGELVLTDTDRRYYTHEIRELERFRAMGLSDVFMPEEGSPEWNNAHTATLEDFKLGASDSLLYSADALDAGDKQIERIYENLLKGGVQ